MSEFYVYLIRNLINGKIYVGKTNNLKIRWTNHKKVALGGKEKYPNDFFAIHAAISKYGIENFKFEAIEEFDMEDEAYYFETWWVEFLETHRNTHGYNCDFGGKGGVKATEETRRKISEAQIGEKNHMSILTDQQVTEILDKYINSDCSQRQLAREYGIHFGTLNDILTHKTWKHLTASYEHKRKRYSRTGEKSKNNKLTAEQVCEVIKLYNTGEYTYKKLGEMFNVVAHTIGAIIRGTNWKHIKRD